MARPTLKHPELVEIDEDHAKSVGSNMIFMVWRRRTQADAYRRAMKLVEEMFVHHREGVGVCQVVEVDAIPPDAQARVAFVEFLRMPQVSHYSVTHDGAGFKAASVRAIVASVHALARPSCRHSVHSSVADAARWHARMQEKLSHPGAAQEIENAMQSLRRLHRERYP